MHAPLGTLHPWSDASLQTHRDGAQTARPSTVKPHVTQGVHHPSGALTSRQLQTAQASRSRRQTGSKASGGSEDFWEKQAAEAKGRLRNPPGAEFYVKGFQKLPLHKLEYEGNGFYKIDVQGENPRLIKSDQDMLDVASIMRWRALSHTNAHASHKRGVAYVKHFLHTLPRCYFGF